MNNNVRFASVDSMLDAFASLPLGTESWEVVPRVRDALAHYDTIPTPKFMRAVMFCADMMTYDVKDIMECFTWLEGRFTDAV